MKYQDFKKNKISQGPGVYFFLGNKRKVLYIGKATSLRDRVRSYFGKDVVNTRGPQIVSMVEKAKSIRFTPTDSVLEALILEAELIKKHTPQYNTKEKDDKSFNHIVITKEEFPRVLIVRGRELEDKLRAKSYKIETVFGPYPRGGALKEALKIIRKIFPFRDTCLPGTGKACFNHQIGLCPGVCNGEISKNEYRSQIRNLKLFLQGRKKVVIRNLIKEMKVLSKRQEFERANKVKKTIFALNHIQDVALMKKDTLQAEKEFRIESYDIAHMGGIHAVGVMTVVVNGEAEKSEYRKFKIKSFKGVNDTRALKEILERRLGHPEWPMPKLIVVDGGKAQKNAAEAVLSAAGVKIPVVGVIKNEYHRPREILGEQEFSRKFEREILLTNSEAHRFAIGYHKKLRRKLK